MLTARELITSPLRCTQAIRRSYAVSSRDPPASGSWTVLEIVRLASRSLEAQGRDLVVEVRTACEAPPDVGILDPRGVGEGADDDFSGARMADSDREALVGVERLPIWRADSLVDGAAHVRVAAERHLGEVGVMDVAGEDADRGRWTAALARADLLQQGGESHERALKALQ